MTDWIHCCIYKVYPLIGSGSCTTLKASIMDQKLNLSRKDFWLVIYLKENDPGEQFQIIPNSWLVDNSWETLKRGLDVTISCGNGSRQAGVVYVSDNPQYLQRNFETITEEFLEELESHRRMIQLE